MFNPRIKFEMSTITCNEEIKCNAKCKNSRFEPPFGDSGVTDRIHLWLDGKRIVDFLLVITELFSLAFTAEALLSKICRNRRFLKGWVTLSVNFTWMGTLPATPQFIYGPLDSHQQCTQSASDFLGGVMAERKVNSNDNK